MTPPVLPLEVRGLSKAYRRRSILKDVSFSVAAGEAVAVLGPNGAGKSTLLGCITGDRLPDAGAIRVCGIDPLSDLPGAARCTGVVSEHPFLYGELTVAETLKLVQELRAPYTPDVIGETERLLALLGLAGAEGALCRELSQGMGRKVAIIAGLLHHPRLIVLDEAFNGLDRPSAERLAAELAARRDRGAALLLSSHDLGFLAEFCERGLLIRDSRVALLEREGWERWRADPSLDAA